MFGKFFLEKNSLFQSPIHDLIMKVSCILLKAHETNTFIEHSTLKKNDSNFKHKLHNAKEQIKGAEFNTLT